MATGEIIALVVLLISWLFSLILAYKLGECTGEIRALEWEEEITRELFYSPIRWGEVSDDGEE